MWVWFSPFIYIQEDNHVLTMTLSLKSRLSILGNNNIDIKWTIRNKKYWMLNVFIRDL